MNKQEIKETLEKQLQLLSKRSEAGDATAREITDMTNVMTSLVYQMLDKFDYEG